MEQTQNVHDAGPLWEALAAGANLLETDPDGAEQQARRVLTLAPGQQQALQLLISARRVRGDIAGAQAVLEAMRDELPQLAAIHYELGLLMIDKGESAAAAGPLSRVVELEPKHPQAWRALGDVMAQAGDTNGAANAYAQQYASSVTDLKTLEQVSALDPDQIEVAEDVLREFLNIYSTDLAALEMLGKLHLRVNQYESAEKVFEHALSLCPSFRNARLDLISALHQQLRPEEENRQLDILLADDPDNPELRALKATALSASGRVQEAIAYCEELLRAEPDQHRFWLAYAHALRVAGRRTDCVGAYRKAIQLDPRLGDAWWGLANLKTFRFEDSDIETMRAELLREDLTDENREFLHFALGEALEDVKAYEESFRHYSRGNALVRAKNPYNIEEIVKNVAHEKRRFTRDFLLANARLGSPSADPIFILGLPRSGSTLVEQILASHSSVEGLGELPALTAVVRGLEAKRDDRASDDAANDLFEGEDLKSLGEEYLERCRNYRRMSRAHFTDKMPSNFRHLGLICSILPSAKIIDARRHPLACCFSNFKQIFPFRQGPSYDLADIGRYYRSYVELMAHFDRVLAGRIHRVIYEKLVADPEAEIRALLNYCGLPFEEGCLRFYETERGVRTISSEQVRRPIYSASLEQWRNFEQWLGPLKAALGPVLDAYPATPDRF